MESSVKFIHWISMNFCKQVRDTWTRNHSTILLIVQSMNTLGTHQTCTTTMWIFSTRVRSRAATPFDTNGMHNNWHLANSYLSYVTHIAEASATATPQKKKKKKNSIILFYKFVQLEFYFVQLVIFKSIHLNTFFYSNANVRFLTTKKNTSKWLLFLGIFVNSFYGNINFTAQIRLQKLRLTFVPMAVHLLFDWLRVSREIQMIRILLFGASNFAPKAKGIDHNQFHIRYFRKWE